MGYYTTYSLYVENLTDEQLRAVDNELAEVSEIEAWGDGWGGCVKWYDHEDDLRRISALFPNALFTLDGEGEGSDDIWRDYYKNGKMQHCPARIEFDPYDESKLT